MIERQSETLDKLILMENSRHKLVSILKKEKTFCQIGTTLKKVLLVFNYLRMEFLVSKNLWT